MRLKWFLSPWYIRRKLYTYLASRLSTVSKQTESCIHLSLVTLEYHQVRPKRFQSLWYVRRKPCNYLASSLALSPIELNRASTWASYHRVPSGVSKTISVPTVCLAQIVHLSCTDINTVFKWTKTRFHMTHVTLEFDQMRPKWFLRLWYVRQKHCTYLVSRLALYQMNWLKHPLELHHLGVLSGASKTISEPTVWLALSVHLSCTDTNTIFKWTKTRFYMTHVTLEFHRGHPKRFLRI
jgi:hypothetical protein